jgi:hypothetical protein
VKITLDRIGLCQRRRLQNDSLVFLSGTGPPLRPAKSCSQKGGNHDYPHARSARFHGFGQTRFGQADSSHLEKAISYQSPELVHTEERDIVLHSFSSAANLALKETYRDMNSSSSNGWKDAAKAIGILYLIGVLWMHVPSVFRSLVGGTQRLW